MGKQKGEERKTPGCRLTVGRPRALKLFPTARPSPAPLQPSLHPPSPRFGQCTNMTDTLMLRCATLGSTLCCWPNLQPVNGLREPKCCQSFSRFPPAVLLPQTSRLCCMSLVRFIAGCFTNTLRGRICEKTPLSKNQIYYCN